MTSEKVIEVIETYRQLFVERSIGKIDYPNGELLNEEVHGLSNIATACSTR